jgi:hypothetical protein
MPDAVKSRGLGIVKLALCYFSSSPLFFWVSPRFPEGEMQWMAGRGEKKQSRVRARQARKARLGSEDAQGEAQGEA